MTLAQSYRDHRYWENYQPYFPEHLRASAQNSFPNEEYWHWKRYQVHLDRVDLVRAPLRVILIHGAGGYGRFLSPLGYMLSREGFSWVAPDLPSYGLTAPRTRQLKYSDWIEMVSDLIDRELARDPAPIVLLGLRDTLFSQRAFLPAPRRTQVTCPFRKLRPRSDRNAGNRSTRKSGH